MPAVVIGALVDYAVGSRPFRFMLYDRGLLSQTGSPGSAGSPVCLVIRKGEKGKGLLCKVPRFEAELLNFGSFTLVHGKIQLYLFHLP